ncbi:MAG: SusC/RagA family TonB-linked outer membrane protein [Pseudosphingobacterium sp.]|nr:SusC/RagA family TonB-linked outer membrane protein [Pseudosphingobacterium sp.]
MIKRFGAGARRRASLVMPACGRQEFELLVMSTTCTFFRKRYPKLLAAKFLCKFLRLLSLCYPKFWRPVISCRADIPSRPSRSIFGKSVNLRLGRLAEKAPQITKKLPQLVGKGGRPAFDERRDAANAMPNSVNGGRNAGKLWRNAKKFRRNALTQWRDAANAMPKAVNRGRNAGTEGQNAIWRGQNASLCFSLSTTLFCAFQYLLGRTAIFRDEQPICSTVLGRTTASWDQRRFWASASNDRQPAPVTAPNAAKATRKVEKLARTVFIEKCSVTAYMPNAVNMGRTAIFRDKQPVCSAVSGRTTVSRDKLRFWACASNDRRLAEKELQITGKLAQLVGKGGRPASDERRDAANAMPKAVNRGRNAGTEGQNAIWRGQNASLCFSLSTTLFCAFQYLLGRTAIFRDERRDLAGAREQSLMMNDELLVMNMPTPRSYHETDLKGIDLRLGRFAEKASQNARKLPQLVGSWLQSAFDERRDAANAMPKAVNRGRNAGTEGRNTIWQGRNAFNGERNAFAKWRDATNAMPKAVNRGRNAGTEGQNTIWRGRNTEIRDQLPICSSVLGRTTASWDQRRFWAGASNDKRLPEKEPQNARKLPQLVGKWLQSAFDESQDAANAMPKAVNRGRNAFNGERNAKKIWRNAKKFRRNASALKRGAIPSRDRFFGSLCKWALHALKPCTAYLITLKILFCVCLAHARQSSSPEAAYGVALQNFLLKGKVVSAVDGEPLAGATIKPLEGAAVLSQPNGSFVIHTKAAKGALHVSFVGYRSQEVSFDLSKEKELTIYLVPQANTLDETVVMAYGTTTRRFNTGNIAKLSAEEIAKQPVANPLSALSGRVPGLVITQSSGVAGAGVRVQLRGQNSLLQGSQPLFIIDGVPFANGNNAINQLNSAAGAASEGAGMSPFNLINPNDIESIEILKDADATAIYGSRGANGVVLITTKKGQEGKGTLGFNFYSGLSTPTRNMRMLNTQEYLMMRKEAFANDGLAPTTANAPDLLLWDTTRYTNFHDLLIGNTAATNDIQLSYSAGTEQSQFLLRGSYHNETSVYPTDLGDTRAALHAQLGHQSADNRLKLNFTSSFSVNRNNLTASDLAGYVNTNPMLKLYDENGQLNWAEGGISYTAMGFPNMNPLKFQYETYEGNFKNLNSNMMVDYRLPFHLNLKVSLGYNMMLSDEVSTFPSSSLNPYNNLKPSSNFGNRNLNSWIAEPQLTYENQWAASKVNVLLGATWQNLVSKGSTTNATNYSNDLLLESIAAAGNVIANNSHSQYRYQGVYARINYNLLGRYVLNASGRRDGSSRFAPQNRFANFAALGLAWLLSEERFLKNQLPFLSFAKIRASYGITGNDQIGDYRYLDTWTPATGGNYQGIATLNPTALFNPSYAWEKNKKLEVALELGLLDDRILLSSTFYRNISSNQLVNYTLPTQTGFSSVLANLNAKILNRGWEGQLETKNIQRNHFSWNTLFNITLPANRLLEFPGLEQSSYRNVYEIGQPLSVSKMYHYLGVNSQTGLYEVRDVNGDDVYDMADRTNLVNTEPKFYGGLQNSFRYRNFQLDVFFEFRKQLGRNYLSNLGTVVPGYRYYNQPAIVLERWQKPGDVADIQRFTANNRDVLLAASQMRLSDAIFSDASFLRCKNVAVSYLVPAPIASRIKLATLRVYAQAQNLFTLTNYRGEDPENQNFLILPPLRTITLGLQLTI